MASLLIRNMQGGLTHTSLLTGKPIILILQMGSGNKKTGMVDGLWIMASSFLKGVRPSDAIKKGHDQDTCADCHARSKAAGGTGACYAHGSVAQKGGYAMHEALMRNGYRAISWEEAILLIASRRAEAQQRARKKGLSPAKIRKAYALRLGVLGDPSALEYDLIEGLCIAAERHLGYFHQRRLVGTRFASLAMVSCDSYEEAQEVHGLALRSFTVGLVEEMQPWQMLCPSSKEYEILKGHRIPCIDCGLCNGTPSLKEGQPLPLSILIPPHGNQERSMKKALAAAMAIRIAEGWIPEARAMAMASALRANPLAQKIMFYSVN